MMSVDGRLSTLIMHNLFKEEALTERGTGGCQATSFDGMICEKPFSVYFA